MFSSSYITQTSVRSRSPAPYFGATWTQAAERLLDAGRPRRRACRRLFSGVGQLDGANGDRAGASRVITSGATGAGGPSMTGTDCENASIAEQEIRRNSGLNRREESAVSRRVLSRIRSYNRRMVSKAFRLAVLLSAIATSPLLAQQTASQLANLRHWSGQGVAPVYEGFDINADGSFNMWFGYMNRNYEEELDIPVGAGNTFEPGARSRPADAFHDQASQGRVQGHRPEGVRGQATDLEADDARPHRAGDRARSSRYGRSIACAPRAAATARRSARTCRRS